MNTLRSRLCLMANQITRNYCSSTKLVDVTVNDKTGIATVTMKRQPVNGLNIELLKTMTNVLTELQNNKARGMILTSVSIFITFKERFNYSIVLCKGCNTVFSAGLDILEMYKPDQKRAREFWMSLQEFWMTLYGTSFPTAAAINVQ